MDLSQDINRQPDIPALGPRGTFVSLEYLWCQVTRKRSKPMPSDLQRLDALCKRSQYFIASDRRSVVGRPDDLMKTDQSQVCHAMSVNQSIADMIHVCPRNPPILDHALVPSNQVFTIKVHHHSASIGQW